MTKRGGFQPVRTSKTDKPPNGSNKRRRRTAVVGAIVATVAAAAIAVTVASSDSSPSPITESIGSATPTTGVPNPLGGATEANAPVISAPGGSAPDKGAFNGVACESTVSCLAVGADRNGHGVVAGSSDGGSTWGNKTITKSVPPLEAVTCKSASTCVAVGQGVALSSTNGGGTWSAHGLPTANTTLLGVTCAAPNSTCVAAGIEPTSTTSDAAQILISKDEGSTWMKASFPTSAPGVASVVCPTASRCIAVGATILTSDNGGQTWQPRTVNGGMGSMRSVSCSSATHCIAVGPNPEGEADPGAPGLAIVTNDGGNTWQQQTLPAGSAPSLQITCSQSSRCLIGGPSISKSAAPTYAASTDGGANWAPMPPPPGLSDISDLACPATNHCVVVGDYQPPGSAPPTAFTGVTTDGTTWATKPVAQP